jgi:hypothetical protein
VRPAAEAVEQAGLGHTMVYSSSGRAQEDLHDARSARAGRPMLVAAAVVAGGLAVVAAASRGDAYQRSGS